MFLMKVVNMLYYLSDMFTKYCLLIQNRDIEVQVSI
jgi:hypothetical protein